MDLFADAVTILKATRRFWTRIEKDIGSFEDFGDVDLEEVTPLSLAVLQMCIDSHVARLPACFGVALRSADRRIPDRLRIGYRLTNDYFPRTPKCATPPAIHRRSQSWRTDDENVPMKALHRSRRCRS